jgi:RHS repeat-associated protein
MQLRKGFPWILAAQAFLGGCNEQPGPKGSANVTDNGGPIVDARRPGEGTPPPSDPPSDPPSGVDSTLVAATAIGATDGEFNVGQSGDASYSITLNLLNGTAGVQPSLRLVYNSSSGDSPLGVGWSLAGQSVIAHCPTTIAQDGFTDGLDFDNNDKYCLDGQRLVAIAGVYGANGTEYRTEVNSFSRIYSYGAVGGGPQRFLVQTSTGQILQYGQTADSRVEPAFVTGTGPAVAAWALNRAEDRMGNYMTYTYFEGVGDDGTGRSGVQHYLTRIDYTGNAAAGSNPYAAVTFEYEQRPDILAGYESGALSVARTRLKRIVNRSGTTTVRSYQFAYTQSRLAGRSMLASVQECGSDGSCLAPTTFAHSAAGSGFASTANVAIAASWAGAGLSNKSTESRHETFADMDGDGDMDRAWVPVGQNSIYVTLWQGLNFGPAAVWLTGPATPSGGQVPIISDLGKHEAWLDVNGDGKTDRAWVPVGTKDLYVALSTGAAFAAPHIWLRDQAVAGLTSYSQDGLHETYGDIDADGRTDYIWIPEGAEGTVRTYAALNTGTGFAAPTVVFPLHTGLFNTSDMGFEDYLDLNNDGLIDYAWIPTGSAQTYVTLANDDPALTQGVRFDAPTVWLAEDSRPPNDGAGKPNFRFFEDVTGDGLSDLVFYKANGSCGEIRVSVNTGRSFLPSRVMSSSCAGAVPIGSMDPRYQQFIDLNDDGRADHVWVPSDRSTIWVAYNQGGTTFGAPQELIGAGVGATPRSLSEAFFDVDGDGSIDRIWIPEDAPNGRFYLLSGNRVSHRLETITNGFGRQIKITYDTLVNPWVYTRDSNATFPLLDAGGSMPVVARTSISDGIGGFRNRVYMYEGMKMHLQGFGNLGMRRTKEIEDSLPHATVRDFSQDYANRMQGTLTGGATVHQRADATPTTPLPDQLAATTNYVNTFAVTQSGGVFRVRLTKTETEERDLYNTVLSKRITENLAEDAYGNTTSLRASTYGSAGTLEGQSTTTSTYVNDAASWSLGLLTRTDVTRSLPNASPAVPAVTRTTTQTWNVANRLLTQEVVEPNAAEFRVTTAHEYDSFGNRLKTTLTPNGLPPRATSITYDSTGRFALTAQNPLGQVRKTAYDSTRGLVSSATDPNNLTVTYGYDGYGRRILETQPNGVKKQTSFAGCAAGCPSLAVYSMTRQVDGQAPSTVYFDVLGREIRTETAGFDGRTILQDRTYDTWGRPILASEPYYSGETIYFTRAEFDKMDRPVRITNPDGSVTTTSYRGNTIVDTNELLQTRTEVRNALGKMVEVLDAQSNRLRYRYDAFGDLIEVRDPMGNVTTMTLDRWGRKLALQDPDRGRATYAYDALGQVTSETDAKGQVTAYEYDVLGRATYRFDHDGGATSFVYDTATNGIGGLSRVAAMSCTSMTRAACKTALGTTTNYNEVYTYDTLGRPSRVTTNVQGEAFVVSNTYDSLGRVDVVTYPAGAGAPLQVRSVYNARGYLNEVTNAASGARFWKADTADARGNVTFSTLGNGLVTEHRYDAASGRLKRIQTDIHGQVSVQQNAYEFDALGNMVSRRDELRNMTEIAGYDSLNRLVNVETRRPLETLTNTITYDALGNILTRTGVGTYTYGGTCNGIKAGPHAVTTVGGAGAPSTQAYCYDVNGDMVRSGTRDVTYASFGKPTRFVQGSTETLFTYGPDRQRYRRVDANPDGNTTTTYIRGYFERSVESGVTTYRNFIGDFAIYTETVPTSGAVSSGVHYVHRDHLDSVEAITDAQARIVERFSFDPWGKRRNPDWSAGADPNALASNITPRGFTNQESIDNFNLVHMNGRVYDPAIGRFMSADPFVQAPGNLQSFNRYTYVFDNPLSSTDPSGFFSLKKFLKKAFDYTFGKKSFYGAVVRGVRSALRAVAKVWAKVPGLQALVGAIVCVASAGTGCLVYSAFSAAVQLSSGASLGDVLIGAAIGAVAGMAADALVGTAQQFGAAFSGAIAKTVAAASGGALNGGVAGGIAAEAQGMKFKDGFKAGALSGGIGAGVFAVFRPDSGTPSLRASFDGGDEAAPIQEARNRYLAQIDAIAALREKIERLEDKIEWVDEKNHRDHKILYGDIAAGTILGHAAHLNPVFEVGGHAGLHAVVSFREHQNTIRRWYLNSWKDLLATREKVAAALAAKVGPEFAGEALCARSKLVFLPRVPEQSPNFFQGVYEATTELYSIP